MHKPLKQNKIEKISNLYKSGQFLKAKVKALELLKKDAKNTTLLNLLAIIYDALNEIKNAEKCFLKVLEIDSNDFSAYNNLGLHYFNHNNFEQSKIMHKQAIKINPSLHALYANLGNIYLEEQNYIEAERLYLKAIALGSDTYFVFYSLAKLYMRVDKPILAEEMFQKAIKLNPLQDELLFDYSLFCLRLKKYIKGFDLYRHRYYEGKKDKQTNLLSKENLLEKGMNINQKRLLLTYEQGFGDVIQFIRYIPMFESLGAEVYVQCSDLLYKLLEQNYPQVTFLRGGYIVDYDYHMPLLNSAYYFSTEYATIPFGMGYIKVDKADSLRINNQIFKGETKKKIGIVWRTNLVANESFTKQRERMSRNVKLEDLLDSLNFPDIELYSLQVDVTEEERSLLEVNKILSLGDHLGDFYDNALCIDNLDAFIGIDTVSTIIAGAMGKETLLLLSDYADWRWTREDLQTNWFKSITIIRQEKKHDWNSVLEKVKKMDKFFLPKTEEEKLMSLGIEHHQSANLSEAEKCYREVLAQNQNNDEAFHYLGLIAYQTGNTEQAVGLIKHALELNPDNHEAYNNLKNILVAINQTEFMKEYLNFKIEKFSNDKFSVRSLNHHLNETEKILLDEIKTNITTVEPDTSMQGLLRLYLEMLSGNFYEALKLYLLDDIIKDDYEGNLRKLNDLLNILVKVNGFYLEANEYELLAEMFSTVFHKNNMDLKYQVQYIGLYYNFYLINRNTSFKSSLHRVSELFQGFINVRLNVEALIILYDQITFMYWGLTQDLQYIKVCDAMIIKPTSKYLLKYFEDNKFVQRKEFSQRKKKRVCYLGNITSYDGAYAIGRVMYSIFKGHCELDSQKFDFYYYAYGTVNEAFLEEIKNFGFKIRRFDDIQNLPEKLKTMRDSFFEDEIDIVISEVSWGIPTYLFESRVAPVQIYLSLGWHYWSISNLEQLIIPSDATTNVEKYSSVGKNLPIGLDKSFIHKKVSREAVNTQRNLYPKDKIIIGSIQRLVKVEVNYLEAIKEILLLNDNTIAILAGPGDTSLIDSFVLEHNLQDKIFTPGLVSPYIYNELFHIYLDTFDFPGGHSCLEAMGKNKPVVALFNEQWNGLKSSRVDTLLATTKDEYIEIVNKLLLDKNFYADSVNKTKLLIDKYTDLVANARTIEENFKELI